MDLLHRLDGPAIIRYDEKGNIVFQAFYINNEEIDEFKYLVMNASKKNI